MKPRVLVVDDEKNIRRTLKMILESTGYEVIDVGTGEEGALAVQEHTLQLVLLDIGLPGQDGLETLQQIHASDPGLPVVMISGEGTIETALEATRLGAFDFLEKPLSKERVLVAVRNGIRLRLLDRELDGYRRVSSEGRAIVGTSPVLRRVLDQIKKVAVTPATVLVSGESGTGKELLARRIHELSPRSQAPFVQVNCAAIPEELIETELFGCIKGAYTGADRARDGKFQAADGGTLFLDEIGDMSFKVQAKILRALQEKEIERVGESNPVAVDVRIIAATNKDLSAEVAKGHFREDLYYRLNVVPLSAPALRDRTEDIPVLIHHFLEHYRVEAGVGQIQIDEAAVNALARRPWPGNIRELKNIVERLAILAPGPAIQAGDIDSIAGPVSGDPSSKTPNATEDWGIPTTDEIAALGGLVGARRKFEQRCIDATLAETEGNVSKAAQLLGIERSNLHKKIEKYKAEQRLGSEEGDSR